MGYKRKELQILGGGFNLLPPGDKVPRTDYLLAQNWRVDRVGRLVSRYGYGAKFTITGAGLAHSAALHGGINGAYYVGCNDAITTPAGSLYYNFGAGAIATGFDGNRIGMAAMNGWMWVMNRSKSGRHNGGSFEAWNLAAPGSSCAAAAAATPAVVANATYAYTLQSDAAYVHYLTIAGVSYSFAENGYSAAQIPLVISVLAREDPNCSVTYSGTPPNVVITPIIPNTLFAISGSDGNTAANVATGAVSSLPSGTYQFYVTFAAADDSLESNPSPASGAVTVTAQAITLTSVPTSADSRVGKRNIYATGGTLGQPYLVGVIPDNATTTITISIPDLAATNGGVVMPTSNDAPPAASGIVGPHFSRLFAFSTAAKVNRLFYTEPGVPQYWPGAGDPAVGNWVDVGAEGEAIVWCTIHGNLLVIYKERSIWMLVGDPATGYLQCVRDGLGLAGQFAVIAAGAVDYFVGPNNLHKFDLDRVHEAGGAILPLFNTAMSNAGGELIPPGSLLPGALYNSTSTYPYAVALGYAMGKLYVGYAERSNVTRYNLLVYHEDSDRWFYHRNAIAGATGWFGFVFDGEQMVGLTGSVGGDALGFNLDTFSAFAATDPGPVPIQCVYQSHYEDCDLPDIEKAWLEVVIDYEFAGGDAANVYVWLDNFHGGAQVGTISGSARKSTSFALAFDAGGALVIANSGDAAQTPALAKNLSVMIESVNATHGQIVIHNVYLYYYEEARLGLAASTIPTDLGSPRVKQCKELQLDIDPAGGLMVAQVYSDLPDNQMALRQIPLVLPAAGRGVWKYPFAVTEGFLWRVALVASDAAKPFRLYSARLLMRTIGVYVEAYEAASGFVWDSMEMSFESGIVKLPRAYQIALAATPIKRAREISLEIETFEQDVTLTLLSDLPGNAQAARFTTTINTGKAGRRYFRVPLPAGLAAAIEGRMFRVQLSGAAKFILYEMSLEILAVGVYIEAYEAAGGAVYDSRELDFGTPNVKEARELELDIETDGDVDVTVLGELTDPFAGTVATAGRQKILIPLGGNLDQFVRGRLLRVILSGKHAFRLYGARLKVRPFGMYLTESEAPVGWDSMAQDLGSPNDKYCDQVRYEMDSDGAVAADIYTDLPGESMARRRTAAPLTTGATTRHWATVPLTPGPAAPFTVEGRSIRTVVTSDKSFRLYRAQVRSCRIGRYLAGNGPAGADALNTLEFDFQSGKVKNHKRVEIDVAADGALVIQAYTEQSGQMAQVWSTVVATPAGRMTLTLPLPPGIRGRLLRISLTSAAAARVFRLRTWSRAVNEPQAAWQWDEYPLEGSDAVPAWTDLPLPATPSDLEWAPLPVNPTEPQWFWAKVLAVEETPDTWQFVDVPFEVTA